MKNNKSLRSVDKFPNIRKRKNTIQLTEKELKQIIEDIILNNEDYDRGELNKYGYETSAGEAMGFEGWGGDSASSSFSGDESAPFDSSSDIFDLKESLKKELRKYI